MSKATIHPDGRIQYRGYTYMRSTVRAITARHVVIHHHGEAYSDNGGAHYVGARYEVWRYESLRRGEKAGTYVMTFPHGAFVASFHPRKSEAIMNALDMARRLTDD